jgi:hypothetical protein
MIPMLQLFNCCSRSLLLSSSSWRRNQLNQSSQQKRNPRNYLPQGTISLEGM